MLIARLNSSSGRLRSASMPIKAASPSFRCEGSASEIMVIETPNAPRSRQMHIRSICVLTVSVTSMTKLAHVFVTNRANTQTFWKRRNSLVDMLLGDHRLVAETSIGTKMPILRLKGLGLGFCQAQLNNSLVSGNRSSQNCRH